MLIGIDFDNTIVRYDALFHRVALEQQLIPATLAVSKIAVRDHLRAAGVEDRWTAMQGYVYGARMDEAAAYPDVHQFMRWARDCGIELAIISHKTKAPFVGPQYDLHAAASSWVSNHLKDEHGALINADSVYFELTKDDKLDRVNSLNCTVFIDDLPEILLAPGFPSTTRPILFDPDDAHAGAQIAHRVRNWDSFRAQIAKEWALAQT